MVSVQASRFSLLNIDDENTNDKNQSKKNSNSSNQNQNQAAKKKNKKKKREEKIKAEKEDLRNLAFGGGKSGNSRKRTTSQQGGSVGSEEQWQQWCRQDEEFAADEYEKNLQQALMQSRLEFEAVKKDKKEGDTNGAGDGKKNRKKKQKEGKPAPMSLEEFNKMEELPAKNSDDSDEETLPHKPQPTTEISQPDTTFFDNVEKDVGKIIHKERMQEEYKKQYAVESALSQQYEDKLEKRDQEIAQLKNVNKEMKGELKQAKERNQQLCLILSQGEMKNKATLLKELNELRRVHEELNQEVADLTESLEKERSKVHQLTAELSKQKGGKHGK